MADWPLPPYNEPRGPLADDESVIRAFVFSELAPYSERFHVEGPVLLAGRDMPIALRIGARSFLIHHELSGEMANAKDLVEQVFTDEGVSMLDEARINTLPLWDVDKINGSVRSITRSAQEARAMLGGGQ